MPTQTHGYMKFGEAEWRYNSGTNGVSLVVRGVAVMPEITPQGLIAAGTPVAQIADPDGVTVAEDAEARAAINDILDALEAFGIVQSA